MTSPIDNSALILVDIQMDFCPGGALAVQSGDEVVAVANRLAARFPLVVATQDWHPAHHRSFASQHPGRSVGDVIELDGLPQVLWPDHCVQGTSGAAFNADLDTRPVEAVFRKGTDPAIDSYSGFFDNARRKRTGLAGYLRDRGVKTLYVMGLATDYCVRATALDGVELGFAVRLIPEGCRAVDLAAGDGERAIREMGEAGVGVVDPGALERLASA
ncbi:MAG: bifunctional nicotinamidase/pyrazinamidase [Gemmatimonadota bacterium]